MCNVQASNPASDHFYNNNNQIGNKMKILIACEYSGIVRSAFHKKGHSVVSCDLLDTELPVIPIQSLHYKGDVLDILHENWDMMIAFPPCTHLAVSGARWFKDKQKEQKGAIEFFMKLAIADIPKICIENPVGIMSTKWRKPDQYIHPWQFGHGETKKTGLWLKNLPKLEPTNVVEGRENRIHKMPPSKYRGKSRSLTYSGVAAAMAEQWG
jgi:hypothetical protein